MSAVYQVGEQCVEILKLDQTTLISYPDRDLEQVHNLVINLYGYGKESELELAKALVLVQDEFLRRGQESGLNRLQAAANEVRAVEKAKLSLKKAAQETLLADFERL